MNAVVTDPLAWRSRGSADELLRAAAAFRELRDPRAMHAIDGQQRALEGLQALADDGNVGCGVLTGGAGLGKSLLRSALHQRLPQDRCAVVVVETGLLGFDDLLLEVLSQLRGERLTSRDLPGRYERLAAFKEALAADVVATGRHLVVLLDDADQLESATLEALGALTNLASDRQAFVVPVLFGQPSLRQKLARLPVLRQRVGAQYALAPLGAAECAAYVGHRLQQAGVESTRVLEPGFVARLHGVSGGIPRAIDSFCRHAAQHAAAAGLPAAGAASLDAARSRLPEAGPALLTGLRGE